MTCEPFEYRTCPECGGEGEWEKACPSWDNPHDSRSVKCHECGGAGIIEGRDPAYSAEPLWVEYGGAHDAEDPGWY